MSDVASARVELGHDRLTSPHVLSIPGRLGPISANSPETDFDWFLVAHARCQTSVAWNRPTVGEYGANVVWCPRHPNMCVLLPMCLRGLKDLLGGHSTAHATFATRLVAEVQQQGQHASGVATLLRPDNLRLGAGAGQVLHADAARRAPCGGGRGGALALPPVSAPSVVPRVCRKGTSVDHHIEVGGGVQAAADEGARRPPPPAICHQPPSTAPPPPYSPSAILLPASAPEGGSVDFHFLTLLCRHLEAAAGGSTPRQRKRLHTVSKAARRRSHS